MIVLINLFVYNAFLIIDPKNRDYIVQRNGIFSVSQLLLHKNVEISLNALATLIFMVSPETQASITSPEIINKVLHYKSSQNPRLRNLGEVFLQEYCTAQQINYAKSASNLDTIDIPLPT